MTLVNVDLADYDTMDFDLLAPIPPGDYEVEIVSSRLKRNKTQGAPPFFVRGDFASAQIGRPSYGLEFEFVVLGPVCRGAKLRDGFTMNDDSMRRLKTLAVAAGYPHPDFIGDTEELHGLRCRVRVERTGGIRSLGCKNVIAAYRPCGARFALRTLQPGTSPCEAASNRPPAGPVRPRPAGPQPSARSYPWKD